MKTRRKAIIGLILGLALVCGGLFAPFNQRVQAAGETFKWQGPNSIIGCGGTYTVCGTYNLRPGGSPGVERFFLSQNLEYQGCVLLASAPTNIDNRSNTYIELNSDGRTGTAEFHQILYTGSPARACPNGTNFPDIPVTMTGDRGFRDQQPVTIKLSSVDPNSPASIEASVKQGHDQPVTATALHTVTAQKVVVNAPNSSYTWQFTLPAGDYTFCSHSYGPGCHNFRVAAIPVNLTYGETTLQRMVTIRAGRDMSGIFNGIVKSEDGSQEIGRNNKGPNTLAQPRIQEIGIENINAGRYQACLFNVNSNTERCQNFEKQFGQEITVQIDNDGTTPGQDDTVGPQLRCEASIFNPLTWLICPLVAAAQGAVNSLNNAIDGMLTIDTDPIFNDATPTGQAFHTAWGSFRNLALGLIVIAGLVMVISQAAGLELLSAYTVRKVLPRLVIATIFITLSWPVLQFLINLTNDVGNGIRALIYTPFKSIGAGGITLDMSDQLGVVLIGAPVIMALGLLALASFVFTAFVSVLIGFLVLFLREAIIMFLVIVSPLAIACSILPNTEKFWSFWRSTLVTLLLVFPIISGFIAICRVFAVVFYNA